LDLLLSKRERDNEDDKIFFNENTLPVIACFYEYFEENEILFEEKTIDQICKIKKSFDKAISKSTNAILFEDSRGSEAWSKAVSEKIAVGNIVKEEISELKNQLKKTFQNRYQLL